MAIAFTLALSSDSSLLSFSGVWWGVSTLQVLYSVDSSWVMSTLYRAAA